MAHIPRFPSRRSYKPSRLLVRTGRPLSSEGFKSSSARAPSRDLRGRNVSCRIVRSSLSPQTEFVETIEAGGVAAIDILARGLKAPPGSHAARSLSYERIECELVEHQLTPERRTVLRPRVSAPARGDHHRLHRHDLCGPLRAKIEVSRKTLIRQWRLKHRAVADSLEEAGECIFILTGISQITGNVPSAYH